MQCRVMTPPASPKLRAFRIRRLGAPRRFVGIFGQDSVQDKRFQSEAAAVRKFMRTRNVDHAVREVGSAGLAGPLDSAALLAGESCSA